MDTIKIAIIAVGTEVTTGQILNKNAQWISQKWKDLGVDTSLHLSVPDDRKLMKEAFQFAQLSCNYIFITGGLGPTTDDFTREVVAEWLGQPLEWHEEAWEHVQKRMQLRGIKPREQQKQECYFPKGSKVHINPEGTACAFEAQTGHTQVFVLPGPPYEIKAIWQNSLASLFEKATSKLNKKITRSWDCAGCSEVELAEIITSKAAHCPFEIGYRVHLPYIEIKLSYLINQTDEAAPWVQILENNLKPFTVLRDQKEDICEILFKLLKNKKVKVEDFLSGGYLQQRWGDLCQHTESLEFQTHSSRPPFLPSKEAMQLSKEVFCFKLIRLNKDFAEAQFYFGGQERVQTFKNPYPSNAITAISVRRANQYFSEMAILFWLEQVKNLV